MLKYIAPINSSVISQALNLCIVACFHSKWKHVDELNYTYSRVLTLANEKVTLH